MALACDKNVAFDNLCQQISPHDPTTLAGPVLEHLISPVAVFIVVFLAGRFVRRLSEHSSVIAKDVQVRTLVRNVVSAATIVFALLAAMVAAGVNISILLTFGGLFSLAIGLAFQDVLRSLLAGMFLLVEQPFRLSDTISVGDQTGVVETIQLRTTALRTSDGRLAVLPNLFVFNATVVNHSAFEVRRFTIDVRLPGTADLEAAVRQARSVLLATKALSRQPPPAIIQQLDGEFVTLHCEYWLDYRAFDPDAVRLELSSRLAELRTPPEK